MAYLPNYDNDYPFGEKIFLRSPFWVEKQDDELAYILIDLRIWVGELENDIANPDIGEPLNPSIKLRSTALNGFASIDIAEFARDFVEVTYNGESESNAVWLSYELTWVNSSEVGVTEDRVYACGFDGYATFNDGYNFNITAKAKSNVMQTTRKMTAYPNKHMSIPVLQDYLISTKLQRYLPESWDSWATFYEVTNYGGVIKNTSDIIRYVDTSHKGQYADRIIFEFSGGKADEVVSIDYANCSKHEFTRLHFVNRLGAVQELQMFGRFSASFKAKDTTFKRNLLSGGGYDKTRHQKSTLNKNGTFNIELSTGWVSEEENDTMIELLLSEQIWIKVHSSKLGVNVAERRLQEIIMPVRMTSDNMTVKQKINQKLINYDFKFEGAFDWINTVR